MDTLFLGPPDADLRAVLARLRLSAEQLQVVDDGEQFADQRPLLQKSSGETAQGTKTVAVFLAETADGTLLGSNADERALVDQWLSFTAADLRPAVLNKNTKVLRDHVRLLNEHLLKRTYIALDRLSLADILAWANLHTYMLSLNKKQRFEVGNITRWFDLIQNTVGVSVPTLPLIPIDLDADAGIPAATSGNPTAKPAKETASSSGAEVTVTSSSGDKPQAGAPPAGAVKKEKEKEKRPKEDKKANASSAAPAQAGSAGAAPASGDGDGPDDDQRPPISRLDLRVGRIIDVKRHENADSLYVEQIEMGDTAPRTVVSGLVKFIPIENMRDQTIVVLANLKPANMRGVKSEAMVMCATSPDGTTVEFLRPPPGSQPGERVYFEGYEGTPDAVLNPKKKIFEAVQPDFITTEERVATWKGIPFRTARGLVTSETVIKGSIK